MIIIGSCLEKLKTIKDESIDCVVTSPPYWGLRDYGTATWVGGDEGCSHKRESKNSNKTITGHKNFEEMNGVGDAIYKSICNRCGAKRIDKQLGLEDTPDEYVSNMVDVFSEVRRVLKGTGTLWLNLGDTYAGSLRGYDDKGNNYVTSKLQKGNKGSFVPPPNWKNINIKPKDLIGIPWRVAFALQNEGWYLRSDIIWSKNNPMPESVRDRPTKSHEYIFLMTKSPKYHYDYEAVAELQTEASIRRAFATNHMEKRKDIINNNDEFKIGSESQDKYFKKLRKEILKGKEITRNRRSVWNINTVSLHESHFAVFPPAIPEICIKAGCPKDGIVLDPFLGSGTTGMVADKLSRKWVGIELNPDYAKIIDIRTGQGNLFGKDLSGDLIFKEGNNAVY